jgi:SAM-dependent methyltransferase
MREKFGGDFIADESTFVMGIDHRLTDHIAQRFEGRIVLETCAGGGFSTIALARYAQRVISIEIESSRIEQARYNARLAQLADKITFICGDALSTQMDDELLRVNAAYLDPDWAVTGPGHVFRFFQSNTRPPTDALLEHVKRITNNIALILPPSLDLTELDGLPPHERERLFLKNEHALYCLYFGNLAALIAESDYKA